MREPQMDTDKTAADAHRLTRNGALGNRGSRIREAFTATFESGLPVE